MALSKLQFALIEEIKKDGGKIHGYKILQRISERGLKWSHQQMYRELNKMHSDGLLHSEVEPIEGKPDRKIYSLVDGAEFKIDLGKLSNDVLIAYPKHDLISQRYKEMKDRVSDIIKELNQSGVGSVKRSLLQLEKNRLEIEIDALVSESLIAKKD